MWSPDNASIAMRESPRFKQAIRNNKLVGCYKLQRWPDCRRPAGGVDFVCDENNWDKGAEKLVVSAEDQPWMNIWP